MADKIDYIEFPSSNRALTSAFFRPLSAGASSAMAPTMMGSMVRASMAASTRPPRRWPQPWRWCGPTISTLRSAGCSAAGGTITRPQFDFPGGRRFHFREPGGNEMAVYVSRE